MTTAKLRNNLIELSSACESQSPEITPNVQGSRLYDCGKGFGRLWKWFFRLVGCLLPNLKDQKLAIAMHKTDALFRAEMKQVEESAARCRQSLRDKMERNKTDERSIFLDRKRVSEWNRDISPLIQKIQSQGKNRLLSKGILDAPIPAEIAALQPVLEMEGSLNEPLPLPYLEKLALEEPLGRVAEKELKRWIQRLDKAKIPVRMLHGALKEAVSHMGPNANLPLMEMRLFWLGCEIFRQRDPEQIRWRESLKKGSVILWQGEKLIIDEPMKLSEKEHDKQVVFSLKNRKNQVLVASENQASGPMRQYLIGSKQWGLPAAEFQGLDADERFLLIERLSRCVAELPWNSGKGPISKSDKALAEPIIQWLRWMRSNKRTPDNLCPKDIFFDRNGTLKALKHLAVSYYDFPSMEMFAFECSHGNTAIFDSIMKGCGARRASIVSFFESIFDDALKNEQVDVLEVALNCGISNCMKRQKPEELVKEVQQLQKSCLEELNRLNLKIDPVRLRKIMKEIFREWKALSFLRTGFQEEVILRVKGLPNTK